MAKVTITRADFFASIQDMGRQRVQHLGLAQSGVADEHSFFRANYLVGNTITVPVIEIITGFFSITTDSPVTMALTGADMSATLNRVPLSPWQSFVLMPDKVLELENTTGNGIFSYLAVRGGFNIPLCFNSASTVERENLGGYHGRKLAAGDELTTILDRPLCPTLATPSNQIPQFDRPLTLRLMPGYDYGNFPENSKQVVFSSEYTISNKLDRTGIRLSGPPVIWGRGDILSKPVALGVVQITNDGTPVILLKERQSTGGYPMIGAVSRLDLFKVVQAFPGTPIRFALADPARLRNELMRFYNFWGLR
ncbi:MAG: biotin-dependent carboxyltransferase family protein [Deltaproteobacteria bacterium]|nr:biotin-dependent carboxyltransferase family protein [Deltaproteobacteria bacterium]